MQLRKIRFRLDGSRKRYPNDVGKGAGKRARGEKERERDGIDISMFRIRGFAVVPWWWWIVIKLVCFTLVVSRLDVASVDVDAGPIETPSWTSVEKADGRGWARVVDAPGVRCRDRSRAAYPI